MTRLIAEEAVGLLDPSSLQRGRPKRFLRQQYSCWRVGDLAICALRTSDLTSCQHDPSECSWIPTDLACGERMLVCGYGKRILAGKLAGEA